MTIHALPPVAGKSEVTLADLDSLPPTLTGHQAAAIYGCSYWHLLELVKRDAAPVAPLRLGRSLRWSTIAVLRSVGVER